MEENVLISVIVPCYNCQDTIDRCIKSILKQDYKHIEVVAIDDGSSDNTYAQLCKMAVQDRRLRVFSQANRGPSAARNLGIEKVQGKYLAFVDSDDYVEGDIYIKMLESAEQHHSDIVICNYSMVFADGRKIPCKHVLKEKYDSNDDVINGVIRQFYDGDTTGLASPCNKLYRRTLFTQYAISFDENLYRAEDWWVNLKLYEVVSRISTVNDYLYCYWQGNTTSLMKRLEPQLYYEWKNAKQYLTKKNEVYGFKFDPNIYYRQILSNIHGLLLMISNDGEAVMRIICDEYYGQIIKYDKKTSLVVRICHIIHRISKIMELAAYKTMFLLIYKRKVSGEN